MTIKQTITALGLSAVAALGTIGYARHSGGTNTENSEGSCYVTRNAEVICAEPAVKCSGDCAFELNRADLECRLDVPSTEPRAELVRDKSIKNGRQLYIFPKGYSGITEPVNINGEIACWDYLLFGKFWQRESKQKVQFTVTPVEQPPSPPPPPPPPSPLTPPEIAIELRNPPLYQAKINFQGRVKVVENEEERECINPQLYLTPRRGYLWPRKDGSFTMQLPALAPRDERYVGVPAARRGIEKVAGIYRASVYTLTAGCERIPAKQFKIYIEKSASVAVEEELARIVKEPTALEKVMTCDSLDGLLAHAYAESKDGPVPVLHHQKAFGSGPQEFELMEMPEDGFLKLDPSGMCGDKIDLNLFYIDFELLNPLNFKISGWTTDRQSYSLYPEEDFNTEKESREGLRVVIKERATDLVIRSLPLLSLGITPVNDAPRKQGEIDKSLTHLLLGEKRSLGECSHYFHDVDRGETETLTCIVTSPCGENKYNGPDQIGFQLEEAGCEGEQTITIKARDQAGEWSKEQVVRKINIKSPDVSVNKERQSVLSVGVVGGSDDGQNYGGTRWVPLHEPARELEKRIQTYEHEQDGKERQHLPLPSLPELLYCSVVNDGKVTFELKKPLNLQPEQDDYLKRIEVSAALRGALPKSVQPTDNQICAKVKLAGKTVTILREEKSEEKPE